MPDAPRFSWRDVASRLRAGRAVLVLAAVAACMAPLNPGEFLTRDNLADILRATSTDALAAAGFTLVMLCGQLDLSIGAVMTLGGVCVMFLQPSLGWGGAAAVAAAAGAATGLANGLLVTRARISSFIVTLGTLTILTGLNRALLHGGSKSLDDVAEGMRMVQWLLPVHAGSPRVLLIFLPVLLLEAALRRTVWGRNLYLIGGNPETAWFAGLPTARYMTAAFVFSGLLAGVGGAFTAMAQNTAMPNLGDKSLMLVVAAAIVAGTAMSGGRGRVLMSVVALAALNALANGLTACGAPKAVKLIANGVVLGAVIAADAWLTLRERRRRGRRPELMAELDNAPPPDVESEQERNPDMATSDKTLATVCVASVACVAIVAIYALATRDRGAAAPAAAEPSAAAAASFEDTDRAVLAMKAADGQPLVWVDPEPLVAPPRPADPTKLADDDLLRWYDYEYSGWNVNKLPMPPSPGGGPRGKKVVSLQYMDHPYWKGYGIGMRKAAAAYGIDLLIMEAGNDNKVQADQVEQVIRKRPDLVILTPVDANGVVPMLKRLHDEKVPVIASNLLPVDDGMKYVLCWTGPDDWGQFRMLAREFAKKMNHEGGYCVVRHLAGTSCYLSRTWAAASELKKIAPKMTCLDMQATDLDAEKTKVQVAAWLKKFGPELKGIVSADDSKAQIGIAQALRDAGREDVLCVAAGSSTTGLKYIQDGLLHAVTYQSAEADGALPIKMAADWFAGRPVTWPVYFIRKHVITAADVREFLPAQW